jgi:hypothetical protein
MESLLVKEEALLTKTGITGESDITFDPTIGSLSYFLQ